MTLSRLVTLSGGGGKTRLALEAAKAYAQSGGEVCFVPLADVPDARRIPAAIVDALQLPRVPGTEPLERIASALGERATLIVLDNFEHLVPEGAQVVQALLDRLPKAVSKSCASSCRGEVPAPKRRRMDWGEGTSPRQSHTKLLCRRCTTPEHRFKLLCLVTSRRLLGLPKERELPIAPLLERLRTNGAAQLLVQRASAA